MIDKCIFCASQFVKINDKIKCSNNSCSLSKIELTREQLEDINNDLLVLLEESYNQGLNEGSSFNVNMLF